MSDIVLLCGPGESSKWVYHRLAAAYGPVQVVCEESPSRQKMVQRRAKRLGWSTAIGQVLFSLYKVPTLWKEAAGRLESIRMQHDLQSAPFPREAVLNVSSVNDVAVRDLLKQLAPKVIVVNGTRILGKRLLQTISVPVINTHVGITPLYRGVHGGYWALYHNDRDHCGVTIHLIDPGIDTGGILAQATIRHLLTPDDNFTTYPPLQYAVGLPHLQEQVGHALAGRELTPQAPPPGKSQLFYHPTLRQYVIGRRRGIR